MQLISCIPCQLLLMDLHNFHYYGSLSAPKLLLSVFCILFYCGLVYANNILYQICNFSEDQRKIPN